VPEDLVVQVMAWLAERGYGDVQEVESAQEHLLFALPPELRRDLRTRGIAET
jgi:4-hydroxy-3-methylbut-2-enyl diphosphate reductase